MDGIMSSNEVNNIRNTIYCKDIEWIGFVWVSTGVILCHIKRALMA